MIMDILKKLQDIDMDELGEAIKALEDAGMGIGEEEEGLEELDDLEDVDEEEEEEYEDIEGEEIEEEDLEELEGL